MKFRVWRTRATETDSIIPFFRLVSSLEEALSTIQFLDDYDTYLFGDSLQSRYESNSGLQVFKDYQWTEWTDENGCEIGSYSFDDNGDIFCEVCE